MERRTVQEWAVLYELEPSLQDVFVEGPTDRAFVRAVLRHLGLIEVQVYDVEAIGIPGEVLAKLGLPDGNRSRVIAFAIELERLTSIDLVRRVCCIADADLEAGASPQIQGALLLYTDYTSMEVYSLSATTIERYLDQVVLGFPMSAETVIRIMEPVLLHTALSRRANVTLGLATAPVDLTDDCKLYGSDLRFDQERFTSRFLNKAAAWGRRGEYLAEVSRLGASVPSLAVLWVDSEDFVDLLHWIIVRLRGAGRTVPKHLLGKTLLLAVPLSEAAQQQLFVELERRLRKDTRAA